jgi:hypothetical protein
MNAARDLARRFFRAASHLKRAHIAIELAGSVQSKGEPGSALDRWVRPR